MASLRDTKIAFVGAGIMGGIWIDRLLAVAALEPSAILACDTSSQRRGELGERYGIEVNDDNREAARFADLIVLAVPPKEVVPVLRELAPLLKPTQILVSVAAAIPLAVMEEALGKGVPIVRVIPNTPSLIGQGLNPVAYGSFVTAESRALVKEFLSFFGESPVIADEEMNAYTGLTAAGPTYLLPVIEALAEAGRERGLVAEEALAAAARLMLGTAALVLETGRSPGELKALTSLQTLREEEAKGLFVEAVRTACQRMERAQQKLASRRSSG